MTASLLNQAHGGPNDHPLKAFSALDLVHPRPEIHILALESPINAVSRQPLPGFIQSILPTQPGWAMLLRAFDCFVVF